MNYLIFGDLHINKQDLPEVKEVLDEIYLLKVKHNVGKIFILGDSFDKINPSSIEIDMLVEFLVKCDVPIVLIAADSHESTSRENSIVNHFGVLNSKIEVVKEWTDNRMFCGHFTLTESKINFGATRSKREFESYKYVFLGHQHTWELIPRNICQVGACRYIDFLEKADKA
jgi:DNA repair exonuclease SbcCD nuclease subunit